MAQLTNPALPNKYQIFIQRFTQYFQQEIKCEDSEMTLQTIITLMNKCGLKEALDPSSVSAMVVHKPKTEQSPPSATSVASNPSPVEITKGPTSIKKSINGYQIFMREKKAEYEQNGKIGPKPHFNDEWKSLTLVEQAIYKERARVQLNS